MRPGLLWLVGNAISRAKCNAARYIGRVVVCIQAKEREALFLGSTFALQS